MQIRLYIESPLESGQTISLNQNQTHYLRNVLRLDIGAELYLFDGQNGEFSGVLSALSKKEAVLQVCRQIRTQPKQQNVTLYFSILKRDCTELVIEKATELGATKLVPVITQYTSTKRVNVDRLNAIVIEACEQCRRLDVPKVLEPIDLQTLLQSQTDDSPLLVHLDETGQGKKAFDIFNNQSEIAFLVGPEGGFSDKERQAISTTPNTIGMDLGERILRAETACISCLALYNCS